MRTGPSTLALLMLAVMSPRAAAQSGALVVGPLVEYAFATTFYRGRLVFNGTTTPETLEIRFGEQRRVGAHVAYELPGRRWAIEVTASRGSGDATITSFVQGGPDTRRERDVDSWGVAVGVARRLYGGRRVDRDAALWGRLGAAFERATFDQTGGNATGREHYDNRGVRIGLAASVPLALAGRLALRLEVADAIMRVDHEQISQEWSTFSMGDASFAGRWSHMPRGMLGVTFAW